jgi:hypothetical protein
MKKVSGNTGMYKDEEVINPFNIKEMREYGCKGCARRVISVTPERVIPDWFGGCTRCGSVGPIDSRNYETGERLCGNCK